MKQGRGNTTKAKEIQIRGIVTARLCARKKQEYIKEIRIYDMFSGDGKNFVSDDVIDGSPIEINRAISDSGVAKFIPTAFYASDNRSHAVEMLRGNLCNESNGHGLIIEQKTALEQIQELKTYLSKHKGNHAIALIDPNGPKELPFNEILLLKYYNQLDIIINISQNAMGRIKGSSIASGKNWWASYDNFTEMLYALFDGYKAGWLRGKIVTGDNQKWRLVCFWSWCAKFRSWEKQGLYKIETNQDITNILEGRKHHEEIKESSQLQIFPRDD